MFSLLSRREFRETVFERDNHKCVSCGDPGQDAHHIIERRLWKDGGYYLENGATLCGPCHLKAEATDISCEELREKIGIKKFPLPEHLYRDQIYDKWGNPIMPNGTRLKGELFQDESVQKILSQNLSLFVDWVKYPRTYHLPWSHGATKDDRILSDLSSFENREIVVTVKMDGEQTTMYPSHIHARSPDSGGHPSRNWVRALHGRIGWSIPKGWRVCGENLFAKHSIHYQNLSSYFQAFSIWNEDNVCLPWNESLEWFDLLELDCVEELYRGPWNEELLRSFISDDHNGEEMEGYVVRWADEFHYKDFPRAMAKFVRKNHVRTHGHWMRTKLVPNVTKEGGGR